MIHSFEYCLKHIGEIGEVVEGKKSLVKVKGLPGAVIGEGVTFETEDHGRVMSLGRETVDVLVFSQTPIKPTTKVARSGNLLSLSAGDGILGHTINTLGHLLSGHRHKSELPEKLPIEIRPAGITARRRVSRLFETGILNVDLLVPLGFGQKELVIGDRKTGKTQLLLKTVLSQAGQGTVCIWCAIGKRKQEIKMIEEFLEKHNVINQCIIVAADSYSSPGEVVYAPYVAMTLAEYFRDTGRDVLLILDDMTTHARFYREISLLSGVFPGRESYPGDIFHVHSKLLERAGNFHVDGTERSITCLPVVDSVGGDYTGYIQTNLMSITDGHIFLDNELFAQGYRPAINSFLSVTRVGRQTQSKLLRDINSQITLFLKKYEDAKRFLRFGPELTPDISETLRLGKGLEKLFNQTSYQPINISEQILLVALLYLKVWDGEGALEILARLPEDIRKHGRSLIDKAQSLDEVCQKLTQEKLVLETFIAIKQKYANV